MKKIIAALAGICLLFAPQKNVLAADIDSASDLRTQTMESVIRTDVPETHKITIKAENEHVTIRIGENQEVKDSFQAERFSEPEVRFELEKGWKLKKVMLGETDITNQIKDGKVTLPLVYEDVTLTVETEKIKETSQTKSDSKSEQTKSDSKSNTGANTASGKTNTVKPSSTSAGNAKVQETKVAKTGDKMQAGLYGVSALVAAGVIVGGLKRRKKKS